MSIANLLVVVYCLVDDLYLQLKLGPKLRRRGFAPAFRDSEVITLLIVGEFLSLDQDKALWSYFRQHWRSYFPRLPSRSQFAKQAANLWAVTQLFQRLVSLQLGAATDSVHIIDGVPLPICTLTRKSRVKRFRGTAAHGYCAAKKEHYFGFKGHLLITMDGVITSFTVTPANTDEREALWDLIDNVNGFLLADKGYISQFLKEQLRARAIQLEVPHRKNMQADRPSDYLQTAKKVRRLIETVFSQLVERFRMNRTWARDFWHFTARMSRKLLAHTVMCYINFENSNDLLCFDNILAA